MHPTLTFDAATTIVAAHDLCCLDGSRDAEERARLAVRLVGRAPNHARRVGRTVDDVLANDVCTVLRSIVAEEAANRERLALEEIRRRIAPAALKAGVRLFHGGRLHGRDIEVHRQLRAGVRPFGPLCDCASLVDRAAWVRTADERRGRSRPTTVIISEATRHLRAADGHLTRPERTAARLAAAAFEAGFGAEEWAEPCLTELVHHLHSWDPKLPEAEFWARTAQRVLGDRTRGHEVCAHITSLLDAIRVDGGPQHRRALSEAIDRRYGERFAASTDELIPAEEPDDGGDDDADSDHAA